MGLKVVFMGTPFFAERILARLLDSAHEVAAVVTVADKPAGRGQQLLNRLVLRSGVQTNDGRLGQRGLADSERLNRVGRGDGDDADVALLPLLWGAELNQRLVDVLVGLVAHGGGAQARR